MRAKKLSTKSARFIFTKLTTKWYSIPVLAFFKLNSKLLSKITVEFFNGKKFLVLWDQSTLCCSCLHCVAVCIKKNPPSFLTFFPNGWEFQFLVQILTRLLYVPIYARLQIIIQLSPIVTKLCHIKCDHPACSVA